MSSSLVVRQFEADEWRAYRELRLRSLADSPNSFGSTLAAEQARCESHWARRLSEGVMAPSQLPLVVEVNGEGIGLAWCVYEPAERHATVFQMWVKPKCRRLGAGRLLLATCKAWAVERGATRLVLSVSCDNAAALRLYSTFGFEPYGEREPLRPGASELAQPMKLRI